ncbi:ABC transporter substrate-binding protein [Pelagibius sp. Alg239-R121]|uniref:ABC transporter substrate-binding protein n=1 Tax=Pelagibius sp. Alg239-R121 TaxID=2993448 RepID=UPI002AC362BC|nr:ABC transporter substrate-binding protein [Pelagibius sp. Alg239-R121]
MKRIFLFLAASLAGLIPLQLQAAGDHLNMGMVLEPPHLDPTAGAAAAIDEVVYANVFEGLTRIDRNGEVKPGLASSWEVSDDGKIYRFTLREGVTFHDGTSMDSSDVIFSIQRAIAEDSVNAQKALFEPIESVAAEGAGTVIVTLKRPTGHFLFNLGWGDAIVVDEESAAGNKVNPTGTGPFAFKRWVKGDRVELQRNDAYWGEPAQLATATFRFIPDPAAAVSAMMAGDVDAFANFPAPESMVQFEADPRFTVFIGSTEGETILSTNNGRPPFDDIRVRQAIAHAIDRKAIIDGAMFGYGTPIGSHFAPHHPAYVDLTNRYPLDLEKAKALLAEAGHAGGFKATLKLPPPSYARRGGEIIASQLQEIGIELEIIPVEWAQWLEQAFRGKDFDLTIVSHTEPMDIGIYARDSYYFDYHSGAFNGLMDKLAAEVDEKARYAVMADAQKRLAEDAVNGFLFQLAKHGVWNAKVKGLWENSPVQANDLTAVSWEK